ncbi:MAG: tRNA (adenosine(37)-N6)-threonylcarbamoyltransferase complex ATPase subunit type 1 TsaE [Acidimicrobiales bacterium]
MITARTTAVAQTRELAACVAWLCHAGDLLVLMGDLGAGKTAFSQGFGAAIGVSQPITSPTFTLANEYEGDRLLLHHLDVFRLEQLDEVRDLALAELLDGESVTLTEWGNNIPRSLPNDYLEVEFTFGETYDDRELGLRCVGAPWSARSGALLAAVGAWVGETC